MVNSSVTDARRTTADCGHEGEYVIGTFVRCLTKGCDGRKRDAVPSPVDPERTARVCRDCGSSDIVPHLAHAFIGVYRCNGCGRAIWQ